MTCLQSSPVLKKSAARVVHVGMIVELALVQIALLRVVHVVRWAAMLLQVTGATSLLKPLVPVPLNPPFSASAR